MIGRGEDHIIHELCASDSRQVRNVAENVTAHSFGVVQKTADHTAGRGMLLQIGGETPTRFLAADNQHVALWRPVAWLSLQKWNLRQGTWRWKVGKRRAWASILTNAGAVTDNSPVLLRRWPDAARSRAVECGSYNFR